MSDSRVAGALAVLAAPVAAAGLVLGLAQTDFDPEAYRDPEQVLALGRAAADGLRASLLLVAFGSYLLLVPLALLLARRHGRAGLLDDLGRLGGPLYLLLGALGSVALAAAWPDLMRQAADGVDRDTLVVSYRTATRLAEDGLQGVVQNVAGAVWFAWLARRVPGRPAAGIAAVVSGSLVLTTLGGVLGVDALTTVGLSLTVLLVPVWALVSGLRLLREPVA